MLSPCYAKSWSPYPDFTQIIARKNFTLAQFWQKPNIDYAHLHKPCLSETPEPSMTLPFRLGETPEPFMTLPFRLGETLEPCFWRLQFHAWEQNSCVSPRRNVRVINGSGVSPRRNGRGEGHKRFRCFLTKLPPLKSPKCERGARF